jgi:hypothetical protein
MREVNMRMHLGFAFEYIKERLKKHSLLFQHLKLLFNAIFSHLQKVKVYKITGTAIGDGDAIATLFAGTENSAYQFASLVYCQINEIRLIGLFRFIQATHMLTSGMHNITAVRVQQPMADKIEREGYLLLPNVSFSLDLRKPEAYIIGKMSGRRRKEIKKIGALNYSFTVSRGIDEDLNFFYWKMYLPHTRQRFGKSAYVKSFSELRAAYKENGGIIFVRKLGKPIAGIIFRIVKKTLYALSIGSIHLNEQGSRNYFHQAALFFLIKWAKEQGVESLDYGTSLPFFREGAFTYKKEWGMTIEEPQDRSFCALKLNCLSSSTLHFIQQNPFIVLLNNMLKGIIFLDHKPSQEELQQLFSEYYLPNLESMLFVSYYMPENDLKDNIKISGKSQSFEDYSSKSLSSICQLFLENGYRVEVLEMHKSMR